MKHFTHTHVLRRRSNCKQTYNRLMQMYDGRAEAKPDQLARADYFQNMLSKTAKVTGTPLKAIAQL